MLDEAIRRYDGKLAFALCPAPLNTQCNPYIPRDVDEFKGSCDLAKIGLAVWAANREAFPTFNRWMYSLDSGDRWSPRSLEAATDKAIELVGQAKFDAALADRWIDQYLQTSIHIYGDTIQNDRHGNALPKLVFGFAPGYARTVRRQRPCFDSARQPGRAGSWPDVKNSDPFPYSLVARCFYRERYRMTSLAATFLSIDHFFQSTTLTNWKHKLMNTGKLIRHAPGATSGIAAGDCTACHVRGRHGHSERCLQGQF